MSITIKSVHVTEYQQATWGRVYVQYEQDDKVLFIFKNWIQFEEKTYKDVGSLTIDKSEKLDDGRSKHVYFWFEPAKRHIFDNYKEVLNGKADHLYLTSDKYKKEYGTPSLILKRLLIELRANLGESAENRKGWFKRFQKPEIVLSDLAVDKKHKILFPYFELELKLEPMLKLVYLLFLNHLEGIKIKDIDDHKNELIAIYNKISKSDDKAKMTKRINELTDISKNSLHEKISKINKIIADELGEKLAIFYQITGSAGQTYKINLSSELISFQ